MDQRREGREKTGEVRWIRGERKNMWGIANMIRVKTPRERYNIIVYMFCFVRQNGGSHHVAYQRAAEAAGCHA